MRRKIIHVDMDCFYVAVEARDNPRLRQGPVAVGGRPDGRGVVATANYEARKYGVRSAMPSYLALKRCSQLQLVPPNFTKYKAESGKIREIFLQMTQLIEPLSLDEAFLDVSEVSLCGGSATHMASQLRKSIWQECGLMASAGIAANKFLAKVASDWNKPNGQKTIEPHEMMEFVAELPVGKIPGVGRVTERKMHGMGWFCCGDLRSLTQLELLKAFGSWGPRLYDLCRAKDETPVRQARNRKTLSLEETFSKNLEYWDEIEVALRDLFRGLMLRWEKSNLSTAQIRGHFVKLKTSDFTQKTHEKKGGGLGSSASFSKLFRSAWQQGEEPIRLMGMGYRLGSVDDVLIEQSQMSFFSDQC